MRIKHYEPGDSTRYIIGVQALDLDQAIMLGFGRNEAIQFTFGTESKLRTGFFGGYERPCFGDYCDSMSIPKTDNPWTLWMGYLALLFILGVDAPSIVIENDAGEALPQIMDRLESARERGYVYWKNQLGPLRVGSMSPGEVARELEAMLSQTPA